MTTSRFELHTERLGPLPLINFFLNRLQVPDLFRQFAPAARRGAGLACAKSLGVLLRSWLVEREPIYRQQETVAQYAPRAFDLSPAEAQRVGDDAIGRALDRLFDADRGTLLKELVLAARDLFGLKTGELRNDSATVRFTGQYRGPAAGPSVIGRFPGSRMATARTTGRTSSNRSTS